MFSALNTVPVKYYVAALLCGLGVFVYNIIFSFQKQYTVSITAIVNTPGAVLNKKALPLSELDTSKVNPYNRLKKDISDLQDFKYNPAYQNHSLNVEPGTRFYNSLDISLSTFTIQEGEVLLYRLIGMYNFSFRRKQSGQEISSDKFNDQLEDVSRQLLFLQNFPSGAHDERRLRRTAETLTALAYYVAQPVSQFSLIPNTFDVENRRIAALISAFNEVQNKKQYLLSHDKRNVDGLSLFNKQLSTLQSDLKALIHNDQLMIDGLLNIVGSGNNEAQVKLKDSLLMIYAKLIQIKANRNSVPTERLLVVGKLRSADNHWPLIKAVAASLIVTILFLIILIISNRIGLYNKISIDTSDKNVKKNLTIGSLYLSDYKLSSKSTSVIIETIANIFRQKSPENNVYLFTTFTGGHKQLSIAVAIAKIFSSSGQTVVLVNLDFSEKVVSHEWIEPDSVGVKDFIVDKTIHLDVLPQVSADHPNVSYIGMGMLDGSNFKDRQTAYEEAPCTNFNPDMYINHPRLKLLIDELRAKYRYIFLHASPLTSPADVLPFSNTADHTVLFVQKGGLTVSASGKIDEWIKEGHLNDVALIEV